MEGWKDEKSGEGGETALRWTLSSEWEREEVGRWLRVPARVPAAGEEVFTGSSG